MPAVRAYVKANGTKVRAHWRNAAGSNGQVALLVAVVLVVFAASGGGAAGANGERGGGGKRLPGPRPTTVYPITWPGWDKPAPKPSPTVSYPIVFPTKGGR
ncbi:hypothetical protein [Streptomyces sp. NPDC047097]|uniref:hypothetical protein n=1 Tax=Streptomyces sp. NPDC047097 TaxID=3155260 RepID=UPI0033E16DA7